MSEDYAGNHHFQVGAAAEDIGAQMARFQKAQQEEQAKRRSDHGTAPSPPVSPLQQVVQALGQELGEQSLLLTHLYDRLGQAGVLLEPAPVINDLQGKPAAVPNFPLGEILAEYRSHVVKTNLAVRHLLEQLAL